MGRYEVVIFDFDGTLVDSRAAVLNCMKETIEVFFGTEPGIGTNLIETEISKGSTLSEAFLALLEFIPPSDRPDVSHLIEVYRSRYRSIGRSLTACYPGVVSVLKESVASGIRCVLLSNKGEEAVDQALKHLDIGHFFDLVVAERSDIARKPNPSAFTAVVRPRYLSTEIAKFLMVGDTSADILFAQNAGIDICWARYGYGDGAKCVLLHPTYKTGKFTELFPLL